MMQQGKRARYQTTTGWKPEIRANAHPQAQVTANFRFDAQQLRDAISWEREQLAIRGDYRFVTTAGVNNKQCLPAQGEVVLTSSLGRQRSIGSTQNEVYAFSSCQGVDMSKHGIRVAGIAAHDVAHSGGQLTVIIFGVATLLNQRLNIEVGDVVLASEPDFDSRNGAYTGFSSRGQSVKGHVPVRLFTLARNSINGIFESFDTVVDRAIANGHTSLEELKEIMDRLMLGFPLKSISEDLVIYAMCTLLLRTWTRTLGRDDRYSILGALFELARSRYDLGPASGIRPLAALVLSHRDNEFRHAGRREPMPDNEMGQGDADGEFFGYADGDEFIPDSEQYVAMCTDLMKLANLTRSNATSVLNDMVVGKAVTAANPGDDVFSITIGQGAISF